jgi:hypothetical protein
VLHVSAAGQQRRFRLIRGMSGLPHIATAERTCRHRCSGPISIIRSTENGSSGCVRIGVYVGAGFKPAPAVILRGGRMIQRTSRERRLPKQGGFETRPYKSPDFVRCLAKESPSGQRGLPLWVKTGKAQTEQMSSGLPPTADIEVRGWHVSVGPRTAASTCNKIGALCSVVHIRSLGMTLHSSCRVGCLP